MATLTTAERNALPDSDFAGPHRSYPIEDAGHAKAAKARAGEFAGPKLKAKVDKKADAELGEKKRPNNPRGNPGHHHSTRGFEHEGYQHTSKHR